MFSSIDNVREMEAVTLTLNTRDLTKPSSECVLETLQFFCIIATLCLIKTT